MVFISNFFKKLVKNKDDSSKNKKKINPFIQKDADPFAMWRNVGELGDGAFGKVFKAEHKEDQRVAALKQVEFENDEDLEDLMVEIDILTLCKHKNIVDLFEAYLHEGKIWMYIEFCGGGAIDSLMMELEKPMTEPQIRYVAHEMCAALAFLHSHFIIHRDLKAGNVLLTLEGSVKLADFGVSAKNRDEKQKRDTFIGTPYWMAPEVIGCEMFKDQPYDQKADIWSFAITLIEFAEMKPPNSDMHPMRVGIKIQKSEPPRLTKATHWSQNFHAFLKKCLWKLPDARLSAEQLLQEPFIKDVKSEDNLAIRQLIYEAKAEVIETVEESDANARNSTNSYESSEDGSTNTDDDLDQKELLHNRQLAKPDIFKKKSASEPLLDPAEVSTEDYNAVVEDCIASVIEDSGGEEHSVIGVALAVKQELLDEIYATVEVKIAEPSADIAAVICEVDKYDSDATEAQGAVGGWVATEAAAEPSEDPRGASEGATKEAGGEQRMSAGEKSAKRMSGIAEEAGDVEKEERKEEDEEENRSVEEGEEKEYEEEKRLVEDGEEEKRLVEDGEEEKRPVEDGEEEKRPVEDGEEEKRFVEDGEEEKRPVEEGVEEKRLVEEGEEEKRPVEDGEEEKRPVEEGEEEEKAEEKRPVEVGLVEREEEDEEKKKMEGGKEKEESPFSDTNAKALPEVIDDLEEKEKKDAEADDSACVHEANNSNGSDPSATQAEVEAEAESREEPEEESREEPGEEPREEPEEESREEPEEEPREEPEEVPQAEPQGSGVSPSPDADSALESTETLDISTPMTPGGEEELSSSMPATDAEDERGDAGHAEEDVRGDAGHAEEDERGDASHAEEDKRGDAGHAEEDEQGDAGRAKEDVSAKQDDPGAVAKDQNRLAVNGPTPDEDGEAGDSDTVVRRRKQQNDEATKRHATKTLKKVRKFTIDGQEYTTTTKRKVADSRDDMKRHREYLQRKLAMREVKRLQIQEQRENRELITRQDAQRDELDLRLKQEEMTLRRNQEQELESLQRHHRSLLDKMESDHNNQMKVSTRRIKGDQDRELRRFRESLKTEKKFVKHEVDFLPKAQRKEEFRRRMDTKDEEFQDREKKFQEDLQSRMNTELTRLQVKFADAIDVLEQECLQECHEKRIQHDDARGELQLRHLQMRHAQYREHQQELFRLKRQQNARRQELERSLLQKVLAKEEAELVAAQTDDLKQLPKLKARDMKVRQEIYRQSLMIPGRMCGPEEERDRIRAFEESERERVKSEIEAQERRYKRRLQALTLQHQLHLKELEEIHAEKQKQLLDQETLKMTELQETCRKQIEAKQQDIESLHKFLLSELTMESKNKGSSIRQRSNSIISMRSFRGSIFSS